MNNKRIEEMLIQIKEATASIDKRIQQVELERNNQLEIVNNYSKNIVNAIQDDLSDDEIEALTFEKEQAVLLLRQHDEVLRALRTNPGSKLNRLRAELVNERLIVIKGLEEEAQSVYQEAEKYRAKLCEQMEKLAELQMEHKEQRLHIDHTQLDNEDAYNLGLKSSPESHYRKTLSTTESKVLKMMFDLTFNPSDFFEN